MASLGSDEEKYKMIFKAPVFKIEIAKKNMSYTVEKFCKKMGGLDKCSDRLFYGLFLLLDIYLNTTKTKVNIKKKSLMRKEEYSQQLDRQMEIQAKVEKEGKPAAGSASSPPRKGRGEPVAKSPGQGKKESKHVRDENKAIENIRKFMLFYAKIKEIKWDELILPGDGEAKYKSVKEWILEDKATVESVNKDLHPNVRTLHKLYTAVFKTHGDLFGGLRDAINEALNTKQAESQAIMAGAAAIETFQPESLGIFNKLVESKKDLKDYFNEGTAATEMQDVATGEEYETKVTTAYDEIMAIVDRDFPPEEDVVEGEVKNLKESIDSIFHDILTNYQDESKKGPDKERKDIIDFENKLEEPFKILKIIRQKQEKQIKPPTKTIMRNLFLKGGDYLKIRYNFYDELRMELQLKPGDEVTDRAEQKATIIRAEKGLFYKEGDGPEYEIKYKEDTQNTVQIAVNLLKPTDEDVGQKLKFLNECFKTEFVENGKVRMMGCLIPHEKKDSACDCCSHIINTIEKHMTDKKKEETYSSLEDSIIKAFDNNVYDTKSDNILLSKEAIQIRKINIDEWRRKKVMGELLQDMTLTEIAEERKFRSWITSCLMPINADGSLFKNEYEHVFPVLFLFLFVGGYIHLPSDDNMRYADSLKGVLLVELNNKLNIINDYYNKAYTELINKEEYKYLQDSQKKKTC